MEGLKSKEQIKEIFSKWKEELTPEEKEVLSEYSKYLFQEVNEFFRDGGYEINDFGASPNDFNIKEKSDLIDSALSKFKLSDFLTVYRNEAYNLDVDELLEFLEGVESIEYLAYVSTSFTKEASEQFLLVKKRESENCSYLNIKGTVPKGLNCGFLDKELSEMGDCEDEILLMRGVVFRHDKVKTKVDGDTVYIEGNFNKE